MTDLKPDYGLDAPGVVRRLCWIGAVLLLAGVAAFIGRSHFRVLAWLTWPLFQVGGMLVLTGGVMVWGSRIGKLRLRDKVLAGLNWRGDERVLDVGCGHGLLLIGAAKRLRSGTATGIDLWQTEDQAGNSPDATLHNARLEGVADRVQVQNGDACKMPFENQSFDAVLSSWALHNIYDVAARRRALEEIVRVLKPGGQLLIMDIRHSEEYVAGLRSLGLSEVKVSRPSFIFFIPTRWVTARKT